MKNKSILLLLSLFALLSACRFLEEDPRSQLPKEALSTGDETLLYLNTLGNLYTLVGGSEESQGLMGTYRGVYDLNTFTTDEAIMPTRGGDWYDGGFWQRLYLHSWEPFEGPFKATWNYLYQVITLANQAIIDLDGHPDLQAEARGLRALYYYELLDLFGNVPLVTAPDVPVGEVKQSSRADVFGFVVSELEDVLVRLPVQPSQQPGSYYGRFTRPVAVFLLAKLWLNEPVYAGRSDWPKVLECCGELTRMGYRLESQYASNFSIKNEFSQENIFTIPADKIRYSAQFQYLFRSRHYDHAAACGFTGENGASATLEALDANGFLTRCPDPRFELNYWAGQPFDLDGKPVSLDTGEPLVYKPLSIALDVTGTPDEKTAGARMRKYELDPNGLKDGKLNDNDIVLFRYADVLLMEAEAHLRMEDREQALACVNAVRARAGARLLESVSLDDILRERMVELAWEGWRRQDLVRFGAFTRPYSFRPSLPRELETGYTTLFPIPSDVLDLNPNLKQNPGYGD